MQNSNRPTGAERAALRLSEAVQFRTVSFSDYDQFDIPRFRALQAWLDNAFPLVHQKLECEKPSPLAVLYRWPGTRPDLEPAIFLAHFDVVPAGDEAAWTHPPFAGAIADGYVWGRGTLDIKNSLVSVLEAAETLLEEGFSPERTLYFAFGGDEEIGGTRGAGSLGRILKERGVRAAHLVDEGGAIVKGAFPLVARPLALIGVAEKGFGNLAIRTQGKGGHASTPPNHTAAGILARALGHLESHPMPARLTRTTELFLKTLAPHVSPPLRPVFARPKLFWPVLKSVLEKDPKSAAMIRSTQAITMLSGSDKENVLPVEARGIVNIRILPGETSGGIVARFRRILKGYGCTVEIDNPDYLNEPIPESPLEGAGYEALVAALAEAVPDAIPVPYLVTASTDTRHYAGVCTHIYRIMPLLLEPGDLDLIHSVDERISVENLWREVQFYKRMMRA